MIDQNAYYYRDFHHGVTDALQGKVLNVGSSGPHPKALMPFKAAIQRKQDAGEYFYTDINGGNLVSSVYDLPFEYQTFDSIICLAVLEHVARPGEAISGMLDVLKMGGTMFLTVPFMFAEHAKPGYYEDFHRWTHRGLESLFEYRIRELTIKPCGGSITMRASLFPKLYRMLLNPVGQAMLAYLDDRYGNYRTSLGWMITARA